LAVIAEVGCGDAISQSNIVYDLSVVHKRLETIFSDAIRPEYLNNDGHDTDDEASDLDA
jgi:hypothetical protein